MRAVRITRPGEADVLDLGEVVMPSPGDGEVRVRVRAFGINRADLLQRRGLYPAPPGAPQAIPGLEYSGEVEALGAGVTDVEIGARVMGITGGGAYADYVVVPGDQLVPMPRAMGFEEAAAVPEAFFTAHDALERLAVVANEWVLVHAVGSGVGTAAVQLVKARDGRCIGTSRTPGKLDRARSLGMDVGLDSSRADLADAIREVTWDGVNAVVDLVGGDVFKRTLPAVAYRGRVILVGLTAGRSAEVDFGLMLKNRLRIEGTVLRSRPAAEKADLATAFRTVVLPLFESGVVAPVLDRVFPMDRTADAHEYLEANANFGKVVVTTSTD